MNVRARRTLYLAAAFLFLAGAIVRLFPVRISAEPVQHVTLSSPHAGRNPSEQAQALLSYQGIVSDDLFNAEREPPASRYVPPELEAAPPEPPPAAPPPRRSPRLFGVAVGPDGAVALIDADPRIPGAEVYRLGDTVGDARLVAVSDTAVILQGPSGRQVLRLPSASRR